MLVAQGDADDVRRVQAEAAASLVGTEGGARGVVEGEGGFEVGTGGGVVDETNFVAEVEAFGEDGSAVFVASFGWGKEAAETAAEVGGAGEVGFGGGVFTA